ncbi:hypothetical protein EV187_0276 [Agromyces ramosus]|uniref:Uncharacterized protein n=1 Tax=Agromyces ramosus TaxID=33879 RepID=A0A4Q7MI13_9MICO|nr:hypothetical protein EV187_0276 [Agromyces ramosus]
MVRQLEGVAVRAFRAAVADWSAAAGLAFAVPFLLLNAVVALRVEPYLSVIRPGVHTGPMEIPLLAVVLFLLPVGAVVALRPLRSADVDGRRSVPIVNVLVALALVSAFLVIGIALGEEIVRCDVLDVPRCD